MKPCFFELAPVVLCLVQTLAIFMHVEWDNITFPASASDHRDMFTRGSHLSNSPLPSAASLWQEAILSILIYSTRRLYCLFGFNHILPEFSVIVADFQGMSSHDQSRFRRSFCLIAHVRSAGDSDHGTIVHSISTMLTDRCILMQLIMEYFPFEVLLSSPLLSRRLSPAQCPGPQL